MKYLKYLLPVFILINNITTAFGQQQVDSVLTLQQCLDIAFKNNLLVKQSETAMENSRINYNQARENLLPTLNASAGQTISTGRSLNPYTNGYVNQQLNSGTYGLSSSLILSGGLTLQNSIRQTSLAFQAGKMDLQQAKNDLTLNIITAFLQVLDDEDQLTQATAQAEVSRRSVERLEILNKDGNVTPSQLSDLKGQMAGDQVNVVNAKDALDIARINLLQIMNVPYRKNVRLQRLPADQLPAVYAQTADQIYDVALNDLAYIKAATLRRESAEKGVQVAQGQLLPKLTLSGGLSTSYSSSTTRSTFLDSAVTPTGEFINIPSGRQSVYVVQQNFSSSNIGFGDQFKNNYGKSISLGLNIPILNYFQNKNAIAKAKLNLEDQKNAEGNTRVQLRDNIDQAYVNMMAAYERYNLLVEEVSAYSESFRIAQVRFDAGVLTSVDFLTVKRSYDSAETSLISARYDYLIRTKILDYYQGRLSL